MCEDKQRIIAIELLMPVILLEEDLIKWGFGSAVVTLLSQYYEKYLEFVPILRKPYTV